MYCNAIDVQNVFFWLVLIAGGVGASIGAFFVAFMRRMRERYSSKGLFRKKPYKGPSTRGGVLVKVSLFLSGSVAAILIAIILLDVAHIEWDQFLLNFFLIAVGCWALFYIGFRWLVIPVVLMLVVYIVVVSVLVAQWDCCLPTDQLLQVRVIAQKETEGRLRTNIEIKGPDEVETEFKQIAGDRLIVSLTTIKFRPWVFYPKCAFLFRINDILEKSYAPQETKSEVLQDGPLPLQVLHAVKLIEQQEKELVLPNMEVLHTYRLVPGRETPEFKQLH